MAFPRLSWARILGIAVLGTLTWFILLQPLTPVLFHSEIFPTADSDRSLRDILNSTLGFQKILVINLPERTDRRDAITLTAAVSNVKVDYIVGTHGKAIPEKAFPPGESRLLQEGIKGSWRGHMTALEAVVHQNLTTALIMEDDADWDVRFRDQLQKFALASRFLTTDKEDPLQGLSPQRSKNPEDEERSIHNQAKTTIAETLLTVPLASITKKLSRWGTSKEGRLGSPYGNPEDWDILWLGHCGTGFPRLHSTDTTNSQGAGLSNIILSIPNDPTVPARKYIKSHPFGGLDPLADSHPQHTRLYHRANGGGLCTIAYAVSQRGARRLLYEFGVRNWEEIFDAALGKWCSSTDVVEDVSAEKERKYRKLTKQEKYSRRKEERVCLTSQPPIIAHHHPENGESDIGGLGGGYVRNFETRFIRWSIRMNFGRLIRGLGWNGDGLVDQWPDE